MSDTDKIKTEIDLIEKVTKQIITLSSGIIVILVTVLGYYFEYLHYQSNSWIWTALGATICLLVSIISGVFVYGSLIGSIHNTEKLQDLNVYSRGIKIFAMLQWSSFIFAIALLTVSLHCLIQSSPVN